MRIYYIAQIYTKGISLGYRNIGVQNSRKTEFDRRGFDSAQHRLEPVATTTTAADGSWERRAQYSLKMKLYADKVENHFVVLSDNHIRIRKMEN